MNSFDENFNNWNEVKKETNEEKVLVGFRNRDIFYMKMGQNIGFEQNGKGTNFVRPIIVLKKFNKNMFFGIPLSTQIKEGDFYYYLEFKNKVGISKNIALLSQMKLYSTNRLLNKIGVMDKDDFQKMKDKFKKLID
jgi:mRNA interferase MazF